MAKFANVVCERPPMAVKIPPERKLAKCTSVHWLDEQKKLIRDVTDIKLISRAGRPS